MSSDSNRREAAGRRLFSGLQSFPNCRQVSVRLQTAPSSHAPSLQVDSRDPLHSLDSRENRISFSTRRQSETHSQPLGPSSVHHRRVCLLANRSECNRAH